MIADAQIESELLRLWTPLFLAPLKVEWHWIAMLVGYGVRVMGYCPRTKVC